MTGDRIEAIPLSLYVHFPWCVKKCPYCDFNSHELSSDVDQSAYVQRLLDDLTLDLNTLEEARPLQSVFMGGGTPSIFDASAIAQLMDGIRERLTLSHNAEVTLEANPESCSLAKLEGYRAAGINRISLGVQSFEDELLQKIGRAHGASDAKESVIAIQQAGFNQFNIDLMFGLPGQDASLALNDLNTALAFVPPHISLYQLTFEPNTVFYSKRPARADDETLWEMQEALHQTLATHGYAHYEVSAFCKPGNPSRHNLNYWQFGDYLGIGAGAHSKITRNHSVLRAQKHKRPAAYLDNPLEQITLQHRQLSSQDQLFEALMNGLRLKGGISTTELLARSQSTYEALRGVLDVPIKNGLVTLTERHLRATERGFDMLDAILSSLLPDPA